MGVRIRNDPTIPTQSRGALLRSKQNISNTHTCILPSLKAKSEQITKHRALILGFGNES